MDDDEIRKQALKNDAATNLYLAAYSPLDEYETLEQRIKNGLRRTLRQLFAFWAVGSVLMFLLVALGMSGESQGLEWGWALGSVIFGAPVGAALWAMYRILRFTFGR